MQIWFEDRNDPLLSPVVRADYIWAKVKYTHVCQSINQSIKSLTRNDSKDWGNNNDGMMHPHLLACKVDDVDLDKPPVAVSLGKKKESPGWAFSCLFVTQTYLPFFCGVYTFIVESKLPFHGMPRSFYPKLLNSK